MRRALVLAAVLLAYPAHADLIIDGSSKASFKKSIQEMMSSYASPEMKSAFRAAIIRKLIELDPLTESQPNLQNLLLLSQAVDTMHSTLDGVTQIDLERMILSKTEENSQSKQDVEHKADGAEPTRTDEKVCDLDKHISIQVQDIELRASYSERQAAKLTGRPAKPETASVTLSVTNTGPFALKAYAVSYALRTDGRTVPWETDDYHAMEIKGGIEPNETITDHLWINPTSFDKRISQPLSLDFKIVDVRDYEGRYLKDPNAFLIDYPNELTELDCLGPN